MEVRILQMLDHKNIVKFKEVIESSNKINLILEFAEGISLLKHLKEKVRLNEIESKSIFI